MTTTVDWDQIRNTADDHMKKAVGNLEKEFHTIRAGRANPAILDRLEVEYYGTETPLKQLANVSVQEGRILVITPYDKSSVKAIETAINKSDLGLVPNTDGSVVRLSIPQLTQERRDQLVKQAKKVAEEARVAIRNVRRHSVDELKKLKGTLPEDDVKRYEEELQKMTDKYIKEVDKLMSDKETDIREV
jgi:ribosome recycling factor